MPTSGDAADEKFEELGKGDDVMVCDEWLVMCGSPSASYFTDHFTLLWPEEEIVTQ